MSATEDAMIAAVHAAEAAAQQLAQAYVSYVTSYKSAASAVYAAAPDARASTATSELEGSVGAHLVAINIASRLVALNAAPLVTQAPPPGPTGPEWVAALTEKITAHVP